MREYMHIGFRSAASRLRSAASLFTLSLVVGCPKATAEPVDTADVRALKAEVEAMAFFRDNEYDSRIAKGYTLPGLWLQPKLTYNPIESVHLELGAHALIFDGANKYPCYAYHDVARWKGHQYQRGAHVLPFFRAEARLRHLSVVLGDIYGADKHQLLRPMFNPEQTLSADPEMGFQLLLDRSHIHLDTWLNWQSYIFDEDTHQEAFTVGTNATILWSKPHRRIRLSTPVQFLLQHRGGEQDTTAMGVQTLANASIGLRMETPTRRPTVTNLTAELNLLGSYQQSGHLWPFDTGFAAHAAVGLTLLSRLTLRADYFESPKQYANLYGSPFFSTLSTKHPGLRFQGMHSATLGATYVHTFSPAYRLGAEVEAISAHSPGESDFCFSIGLFLHVRPSVLIKRWR